MASNRLYDDDQNNSFNYIITNQHSLHYSRYTICQSLHLNVIKTALVLQNTTRNYCSMFPEIRITPELPHLNAPQQQATESGVLEDPLLWANFHPGIRCNSEHE